MNKNKIINTVLKNKRVVGMIVEKYLLALWSGTMLSSETGTVHNVDEYANVRSGPGTSYPIIGTIIKWGTFEVLGETNLYYEIVFEDGIGYIAKSVSQVDHVPYKGVIVNVSSAAIVRSGPGAEYEDIGRAPLGSYIIVLNEFEEGSRYKKVQLEDGMYGYVYQDYVDPAEQEIFHIVSNIKVEVAVNVRSGPGTSYPIISTIPKGESIDIISATQYYYIIRLPEEEIGYVSKQFIAVTSEAIGNAEILDEPSQNGNVIGNVYEGERLEVVSQTGDYYEINLDDETGFVLKQFIETDSQLMPQNDREAVVFEARKYIGLNYSTIGDGNGDTPDNGELDCSGLVKYSHEQVELGREYLFPTPFPRTAKEQWEHEENIILIPEGEELDLDKLQVGDLIFYDTDPDRITPGHVAIYMGEGLMINARDSKGVVEEVIRYDTWPTMYFWGAATYLD